MSDAHGKEFEEEMNKFKEEYPERNPKPTGEILNLQKRLEGILKTKDYNAAHEIHQKILELSQNQNDKWNNEQKQRKMNCEIQRIKSKQEGEFNALKMKIDSTLNEFNSKRKVEHER